MNPITILHSNSFQTTDQLTRSTSIVDSTCQDNPPPSKTPDTIWNHCNLEVYPYNYPRRVGGHGYSSLLVCCCHRYIYSPGYHSTASTAWIAFTQQYLGLNSDMLKFLCRAKAKKLEQACDWVCLPGCSRVASTQQVSTSNSGSFRC